MNGTDAIVGFQNNDKHNVSSLLTEGALINSVSGTTIDVVAVSVLADETSPINLSDEKGYVAEVLNKADIDTAADIVTALTGSSGALDAITVAADADAILLLGGADDDTTQYLYGLNNDSTPAIVADEVALLATITTDITDGIRGYTIDNFIF